MKEDGEPTCPNCKSKEAEDILVDSYGRPWFGLSHNIGNGITDEGIYGTMMLGPSLRGSTVSLNPLPEGGFPTLA